MSGGPATVPEWWKKIKQPQAHERLLGSIEFYRRKWEGGAHWPSSEDSAITQRLNASNAIQSSSSTNRTAIPKEWPGYNREEARVGYLTRFHTCKQNRRAFEKASQKSKGPSLAAVQHARSNRSEMLTKLEKIQKQDTQNNYWEREEQRRNNKALATEASELIRPRPGAVKAHYEQQSARSTVSSRSDWYGRRNTRPW